MPKATRSMIKSPHRFLLHFAKLNTFKIEVYSVYQNQAL